MRSYDLSPLHRFAIGFDNIGRLMDSLGRQEDTTSAYPPYNIERNGENLYRISMAVAGFSEDDLEIEAKDNALTISGRISEDKTAKGKGDGGQYLHRGIATRSFERRFELADHIQVMSASMDNGLLHVDLERIVPEDKKPRKIPIAHGQDAKALTAPKANDGTDQGGQAA